MRLSTKPKHTGPRNPASPPGLVAPLPNEATPLGLADLARALQTLYVPDDLAELAKSLEVAS